jgi:CofD-related protein of GAK system
MGSPEPGRVRITREALIPDAVRLARFRQAPELGVRPLFFSGGTALRGVSRRIIEYTHNSIHLITPFDSGGSSAKLRKAFSMPAVGDLRNRLMALADRSVLGHPETYTLFAFRFPEDGTPASLRGVLRRMVRGKDARVRRVPEPLRSLVENHLGFFEAAMAEDFDLRGANIGNLILAGGYLNQGRQMDTVLFLFSQLVEARGVVRPVLDDDLHLAAALADGRTVVGQHLLTGRVSPPLDSPVEELFLTRSVERVRRSRPRIPEAVSGLIHSADVICYPMGSFYTSLIATLLPRGVGQAVARVQAPKVYVPNPGHDPEEIGLDLVGKVRTLLRYLKAGAPAGTPVDALLNFVLVDSTGSGLAAHQLRAVERLGVQVVDTPLVDQERAPYLDEVLLTEALLSFA